MLMHKVSESFYYLKCYFSHSAPFHNWWILKHWNTFKEFGYCCWRVAGYLVTAPAAGASLTAALSSSDRDGSGERNVLWCCVTMETISIQVLLNNMNVWGREELGSYSGGWSALSSLPPQGSPASSSNSTSHLPSLLCLLHCPQIQWRWLPSLHQWRHRPLCLTFQKRTWSLQKKNKKTSLLLHI